jgi:hypothetical protein
MASRTKVKINRRSCRVQPSFVLVTLEDGEHQCEPVLVERSVIEELEQLAAERGITPAELLDLNVNALATRVLAGQ